MVKYRTESFCGSGVRDAVEVMTYEVNTLGNTDILRTLGKGLLCDTEVGKEMLHLAEQVESSGEGAEDLWYIKQMYQTALDEIERMTHIRVRYVLWLADYDKVRNNFWAWACGAYNPGDYCPEPEEGDIEAYEAGPIILSASDGDGGTLYGYTAYPKPLQEQTKEVIK